MTAPWSSLPDDQALIGLGSNLGDRAATLDAALADLDEHPACEVLSRSTWHTTEPVGGPPGQGLFLNGAALVKTSLTPEAFLALLHQIEDTHGRHRTEPNGPRTLDLDLLLHGTQTRSGPGLVLPHPRMHLRDFVMRPVAELYGVRHPAARFRQAGAR